MTTDISFPAFTKSLREYIRRSSPETPSAEQLSTEESERQFDSLALSLFRLQLAHNPAYAHYCRRRGVTSAADWRQIPAMPASAFKELELTSLPASERSTVFHSSGTTEHKPSQHFHSAASLTIYESSLLPWFRAHLLPEAAELTMLILTPPAVLAPRSSLAHMFETARRAFNWRESLHAGTVDPDGSWSLAAEKVLASLHNSIEADQPVALLGTAFNFVHLLDRLAAAGLRLRLPEGSRVLETGGYKGRSRALPKAELHALITEHLGLPGHFIVSEYGMSELSSQAYDRVAGSQQIPPGDTPSFRFPAWARAQIISPETGREVSDGETGLIRILDLANVYSVMAIQTEDLGTRRGEGFELIGRAPTAEARGCSRMTS